MALRRYQRFESKDQLWGETFAVFFHAAGTGFFSGWTTKLCMTSGTMVVALPAVLGVGGAILPLQVDLAFHIEDNALLFFRSILFHKNLEAATPREFVDAVGVEVAVGVEEEVDSDMGQAPLLVYKRLLK